MVLDSLIPQFVVFVVGLGLTVGLISPAAGHAQDSTRVARDVAGQEYDRLPLLLKGIAPTYPADLDSVRGRLGVIRATIDTTGQVIATRVVRSVREDVDRAWAEAIRQWRFVAARLRGRKVRHTLDLLCEIPKDPPP